MTPGGSSTLLAVILAGSAAAGTACAQEAAGQGHDGLYAVDISTHQGSCEKGYHWTILVSRGRVSSAGDTPMQASGSINPHGIVDLEFQRFGQIANVTGRLGKEAGSGTWSSPTMKCSGSWRAFRQS